MPISLVSTGASAVALLLSLWFLVGTWSNQSMQRNLQNQQDEIITHQSNIQNLQQQLQMQQQQIESGSQLANQIGPAIVRDLAGIQVQNKNQKIADLLKKYGIEINANSPTR